jgi:hypothetical protein
MIRKLNVKMLILNDGQKVIHHTDTINEFVFNWYHFRSGILY